MNDNYDKREMNNAYAWGVFSTLAAVGGGFGVGNLVGCLTGLALVGLVAGVAMAAGVIYLASREVF